MTSAAPTLATLLIQRRAKLRVTAVDTLRGLAMVLMAIDHVRDFLTDASINPLDTARTTLPLFLTRWVTHICAPSFVFLAGMAIVFQLQRRSAADVSRFLLVRGAWLCLLEVTVVHVVWLFSWRWNVQLLEVIWVIGLSMIVMATLVRLPTWAIATFGAALVFGHNLLDPLTPDRWGAYAWAWRLLHSPGFLLGDPRQLAVLVAYALVPWPGVMALGFCFGKWWTGLKEDRPRRVLWLGIACVLAFAALRAGNFYGDPRPWVWRGTAWRTALSFLNVTKYPVSLQFLLVTLGLALLVLAFIERYERNAAWGAAFGFLNVFGRVPFFYFLLHAFLAHCFAIGLGMASGGNWRWYLSEPLSGGIWIGSPPGWGFSLPVIYGVWAAVVAISYPICKWYARVKGGSRNRLFSYL